MSHLWLVNASYFYREAAVLGDTGCFPCPRAFGMCLVTFLLLGLVTLCAWRLCLEVGVWIKIQNLGGGGQERDKGGVAEGQEVSQTLELVSKLVVVSTSPSLSGQLEKCHIYHVLSFLDQHDLGGHPFSACFDDRAETLA